MVRRYAFTMIELIFSIVVIAISVVSLPIMTATIDSNAETNVAQEFIFASETVLNEAIGNFWDANSQFDQNISGGLSRVIDTGDCVAGTPNQRIGHVNRRCLSDLTVTVANDNTVPNTLDSVENNISNIEIITGSASAATYKDQYNATATVTQCSAGCTQFGLSAANADLKEIVINMTKGGNTVVQLRAYSANIGDIDIAKRVMP